MARDSYGHACRPGVLAVSPPDDGAGDFCADMLITGDHILDRRAGCLMAIIADAPSEFDSVKADLLRALVVAHPLGECAQPLVLGDRVGKQGAQELAFDVLADMAAESQPDYSED